MTNRRGQQWLLALTFVAGTVLGGCGDGGSSSDGDPEDAASSTTERETTTTERETTTTERETTTTERESTTTTSIEPLSPTAQLFGTRQELPAGTPGEVEVVAHGDITAIRSVPVVVRNNSRETLNTVEVTALARDASGALAAQGNGSVVPIEVPPGGVAIGSVFFSDPPAPGSTFEFTIADGGFGAGSLFDLPGVSEANVSGDSIVGTVRNDGSTNGRFVRATAICFDADGRPTISTNEFTSPPDLPVGASGSFQIRLFDAACDSFLIGVNAQ